MIGALTNHLWQSTLFVVAAWLVALALRRNGAHVRHAVWLVASLKFLVPFSLLVSLGGALASMVPAPATFEAPSATNLSVVVDQITQPFTSDVFAPSAAATPAPAAPTNWAAIFLGVWACGFIVVALMRLRDWRRIRAAVETSVPMVLAAAVPVRSSRSLLEPGVVGLWRPILLVPAGIEEHLTPAQLNAVLAHELCHVQRRDNLTSAIHMVVEAAFWFHPLVWFVGARLVDERERACDEHVLRVCGEPQIYAESILNVCKLYVESPLACVSGVGGADLRKRVAAILVNRIGLQLSLARKVTLAIAAMLAIVLPLVAGMLIASASAAAPASAKDLATAGRQGGAATTGQAQSAAPGSRFDVVSIKPCVGNAPVGNGAAPPPPRGARSGVAPWAAQTTPGNVYWPCVTLAQLVDQAYADQDHPLLNTTDRPRRDSLQPKRVRGGPSWVESETFIIEARASVDVTNPGLAGSTGRNLMALPATMSQALRATLEDRFQLKVRRATEQQDMYALTIAKGGLNQDRITTTKPGDCQTPADYFASGRTAAMYEDPKLCGRIFSTRDRGQIYWSFTMKQLALDLSSQMDHFVLDQTGLDGPFNFVLKGDQDPGSVETFWTRAVEALGLKLQSTKAPAEYLVIDKVERPRPNEALPPVDPPARATGPRVEPESTIEQGSTAPPQKFDVASIKPNNSGSGQMGLNGEPVGRFVATNVTLKQLVLAAYDLQDFQLIGGPDWMTKDHFDVDAKAPPGGPSNVFEPLKGGGPTHGELMLRSLLSDRFKLEARIETRDMPIYELVLAQADRKPGPGLKVSTRKCADPDVDAPAPSRPSEAPPCGALSVPGRILSGGISLRDLASWLSPITGRTTVDRTGSSERFEFVLKWTPDRFSPALSKKAGSTHWAAIDDDGPSLATALKEQLGLKLESRTGPVKVLVIDSVARLIPN